VVVTEALVVVALVKQQELVALEHQRKVTLVVML
jgi:hypothetical protein